MIEKIGKLVTFYVPKNKLSDPIKNDIHNFFVLKHKAYTRESGEIIGYWHSGVDIIREKHERYEISLKNNEIKDLVFFIESLCEKIKEKCIYVTIGNNSYLVHPKDLI